MLLPGNDAGGDSKPASVVVTFSSSGVLHAWLVQDACMRLLVPQMPVLPVL
jgi:hypothetical protein